MDYVIPSPRNFVNSRLPESDFNNTILSNMRQPRLRGEGTYFVHAISRIVDRRFIFEDDEKEYFCELVRRLSRFTGLDVVAYCVMGNHFHLLVEQPDQSTLPALTKAELLRRAKFLYDANTIKDLEQEFQRAEKAGDQPWIRLKREDKKAGLK